jgi:hypothetical protein
VGGSGDYFQRKLEPFHFFSGGISSFLHHKFKCDLPGDRITFSCQYIPGFERIGCIDSSFGFHFLSEKSL